jgi:hypothetical protein
MNDSMKRLLLVDAPSYFYRAFHALPEFRSPSGEPTGNCSRHGGAPLNPVLPPLPLPNTDGEQPGRGLADVVR